MIDRTVNDCADIEAMRAEAATLPIGHVLRELDNCKPLFNAPGPGVGGGKTFSGWDVPDWLMQRVRAALREVNA